MNDQLERQLKEAEHSPRVYFDHAATTAPCPEVLDVVTKMLKHVFGNPSSFYKEGHKASYMLEDARSKIASLLDVRSDEIFFTSCGTESDNWALKGMAFANASKGRHIITSKIEHHAVLHSAEALEKRGYEVTYLNVDRFGLIDPDDVEKSIRKDTILVSIMTANNEIGTIEPIGEIGAICREHRVPFHSDGVQALGAIPIRPRELNCDMMSFSGHKLYAPKGVGVLYKRKGLHLANFMDGGAQEGGRRAGTENVAYAVGFAKALELAVKSLEGEAKRQTRLRDRLIDGIIQRVPHTKLNGHPTKRLPNNVNVSFEFIEGESILLLLDALGFSCSSGSACTSSSLDPSHVLLGIGMPAEIAHGSLRVTLGRSSTDEEVDRFLDVIPLVVERLRVMSPLWEDYQQGSLAAIIPEEGGKDVPIIGGYDFS
ncbi:MAG: cysteine desulfurase NifS [Clostridiaceae bacterium]|jgi:cysteine desulfurase|nr:cysteine desulfurase NifS [Clostridiaceae bacterium]